MRRRYAAHREGGQHASRRSGATITTVRIGVVGCSIVLVPLAGRLRSPARADADAAVAARGGAVRAYRAPAKDRRRPGAGARHARRRRRRRARLSDDAHRRRRRRPADTSSPPTSTRAALAAIPRARRRSRRASCAPTTPGSRPAPTIASSSPRSISYLPDRAAYLGAPGPRAQAGRLHRRVEPHALSRAAARRRRRGRAARHRGAAGAAGALLRQAGADDDEPPRRCPINDGAPSPPAGSRLRRAAAASTRRSCGSRRTATSCTSSSTPISPTRFERPAWDPVGPSKQPSRSPGRSPPARWHLIGDGIVFESRRRDLRRPVARRPAAITRWRPGRTTSIRSRPASTPCPTRRTRPASRSRRPERRPARPAHHRAGPAATTRRSTCPTATAPRPRGASRR